MNNKEQKQYIKVPLNIFDVEGIYPFPIYILEPNNGEYNLFLSANKPLSDASYRQAQKEIKKGANLFISIKQEKTFFYIIDMTKEQLEVMISSEQKYIIPNNASFIQLISSVQEWINKKYTPSSIWKIVRKLSEIELKEDSIISRTVALSFILLYLKGNGKNIEYTNLLFSAYFSRCGLLIFNKELNNEFYSNSISIKQKILKRYPTFSLNIINKSPIISSFQEKEIILNHLKPHASNSNQLSLILGVACFIAELSIKEDIEKILNKFSDTSSTTYNHFGDNICKLVTKLKPVLKSDKTKIAA